MPNRKLILLLLFTCVAQAEDRYSMRFDHDLGAVTVEACFDGNPPRHIHRSSEARLYTEWVRAAGRDIQHRSARDRLALKGLNAGDCLSWRVNLAAATASNNRRLALRVEDATLADGGLLFWRDADRRAIRIEVELPADASLSVPWKEAVGEGGRRVYFPERTPASWSSRIAVGQFDVRRIAVGGSEIRLAVLGGVGRKARRDIESWISETALSLTSVYGRFPQPQAQVLVVGAGKQSEAVPWAHAVRGGGAAVEFYIDAGRPLDEFRSDWTATHEFSHLLLPHVSRQDRWFSEGLASYYQNVLRARDGRLTELEAWQKLDAGFERGKRATRDGSLARATRSGWGATMRVYWSGAAMMLKADAQLRALSDGRQSLDSALESLQACCFRETRSWRAKELFAELDRLTGYGVFGELYQKHVPDDEFPDVDRTYALLGVVPRSGSVSLNPDAPWGRIRFFIMNDPDFLGDTSGR